MRNIAFMLAVVLCGCDLGRGSASSPTHVVKSGKDRLTLKYVSSGPLPDGGEGFDFHSLIWEGEEGNFLIERAVITAEQFEAGSMRRRWVSGLDSFNAKTGNAIIKVAEANAPTNASNVNVRFIHSWREWNLLTNREVRFIRTCGSPFEKFKE